MTVGFAPPTSLYEYIRIVEMRLGHPLTAEEKEWAAISNLGDIKASRFAGWLALSASSPLLPPTTCGEEPPPGAPPRQPGGGHLEEIE